MPHSLDADHALLVLDAVVEVVLRPRQKESAHADDPSGKHNRAGLWISFKPLRGLCKLFRYEVWVLRPVFLPPCRDR
jgi:hypothetical protein